MQGVENNYCNFEILKRKKVIFYLIFIWQIIKTLVLERTPKYRTSNTPNIECPNIELSEHHILAQNRTLNMLNITKNRTVREHQTVCSGYPSFIPSDIYS